MTKAQDNKQRQENFFSLDLELARCHFCLNLLAQTSQQLSPESSGRAGHPVYRGRHCKVTWWKGYRYGERWVIQSDDVISHILVPDTFGVEWGQTRTLLFDSFAFLFLPQFCATRQDPKELAPSPSSYHLDETFLTQYCVFKLTKQASLVMKERNKIT